MFNLFKKNNDNHENNKPNDVKPSDVYVPIRIGGAYIFDPLGESNQSVTTTAVTVIKEGKHKNSYIVLSIDNGDIFECDRTLLVPVIDYDTVKPLIRCQYGAPDFTTEESQFFDFIFAKIMDGMKDGLKDHNTKELNDIVNNFNIIGNTLSNKIKRYAEISEYKYMLETLGNVKQYQQKHFDTKKELEKSENDVIESDMSKKIKKYEENMNKIVSSSDFYDMFNDLVNDYIHPGSSLTRDEFIDNALEMLEEDFPVQALNVQIDELQIMTKDNIERDKEICIDFIENNQIVFLVGATESGEMMSVAIWDKDDIDEVENFIYTCYNDWKDKTKEYKAKYRVVIINVPYKEKFLADFEEEDYE